MNRMDVYDQKMKQSREKFFSSISFSDLSPRQTVIAMLHLYSKGIRMTEPVPYWIKRAGIRCSEVGFPKVGKALALHAEHEQDHHILYRNDFNKLQMLWAETSGEHLCFDPALDPGNAAVKNYIMLHEELINGPHPYCQVAVELEIEGVSEALGKQIVNHVTSALGPDYLNAMSFITEHAEIDVGHTRFNRSLLSELLKDDNADLEALLEIGQNALATFSAYIAQCIEKGVKNDLNDFVTPRRKNSQKQSTFDLIARKAEISESVSKLLEETEYDYNLAKNDELLKIMKAYLQSDRSYTTRFS